MNTRYVILFCLLLVLSSHTGCQKNEHSSVAMLPTTDSTRIPDSVKQLPITAHTDTFTGNLQSYEYESGPPLLSYNAPSFTFYVLHYGAVMTVYATQGFPIQTYDTCVFNYGSLMDSLNVYYDNSFAPNSDAFVIRLVKDSLYIDWDDNLYNWEIECKGSYAGRRIN